MLKSRRKIIKILLGTLLSFLASVIIFIYYLFNTSALNIQKDVQHVLKAGVTVEQLSKELENEYALKYPKIFNLLSKRMRLEENIKKGRYHIKSEMTLIELIRLFREGKLKTVNLVINGQIQLEQLAKKCGKTLEGDSIAFIKMFKDNAYLTQLGFDTSTVYALILPDLYNVYWHTEPDELLQKLKKEYDKFWNGERVQKLQKLGLTKIEVSVLASIVSKETNKTDEMPNVAGMYLNRLRIDMLLQADPTVKFALKQNGLRRILNGHLQVESPYNTYKYKGLPPGPICIPSKQSIDAVLNFSEHNYLFMCAKEDFSGYHNFAENYSIHLINARKYQQALNERNIH